MTPQPLHKTIVALCVGFVLDLIAVGIMMLTVAYALFQISTKHDVARATAALVITVSITVIFIIWGIFKLVVIRKLRRQRRWAWISALIICGLQCLSFPSVIVGVIGLIGLLNPLVIGWFKPATPGTPAPIA